MTPRPSVTFALGLTAAALAGGCGGGATPSTTSVASVPPPRAPVDPCSLLRAREVAAALRAQAPAGRRSGLTCTYGAGARGVQVVVTDATEASRAALRQSVRAARPPARALEGPGFTGLAGPVVIQVQTTSSQAQVAVTGKGVIVRITLTGPRGARSRLVDDAVALGGAAGRRL